MPCNKCHTQHDASDLHTGWCPATHVTPSMMLLISTQVDALQHVSHTAWCFWPPHRWCPQGHSFNTTFTALLATAENTLACNTLKQLWCKMLCHLLALHWAYLFPNLRQVTARQSFKIRPQSTIIQTFVVQLLVHLIFKQDVVPQGGVLDPCLLWNIGHRTLRSAIIFHDRIVSLLPNASTSINLNVKILPLKIRMYALTKKL